MDKVNDVIVCHKCGANEKIDYNSKQNKVFCSHCSTKIVDWDDPHFGNNMTNAEFWKRRNAHINKDLEAMGVYGGIQGVDQMYADVNNQIDDVLFGSNGGIFGSMFGLSNHPKSTKLQVNLKAYVYNNDKPIKDKKLEKITKSYSHLFINGDHNTINLYGKQAKESASSGDFETAYAYVKNMSAVQKIGGMYVLTAGIIKSVFYYKPFNDFYELAEGLAITNATIANWAENERETLKINYSEMYMRYICLVAYKLFKEYNLAKEDKWFVGTFTRLFHFLEIILTMSPIVNYKDKSELKSIFLKMYNLYPTVLIRFRNAIKNDNIVLKNLDRTEKTLELLAKEFI
ncbi:MAG: hypothetical protein FWE13_00715 [Firmicutes bacterium]|nr:hypothetical protein [Bacillota bacterium]